MKNSRKFTLSAIAYGVGLALPLASHAVLEEVIVTAQKRAESVQDVPIAINALAGDLLDDMGVDDTDDIEGLYPNLSTNNSSAVNSGFAIRGVGTNNFHISGQQSVGTNIDDVAAVSPFISAIGVFDMDRVEVLRGPQNTLYGRNTTGGALNFHTRKASTDDGLNGRASIGVGNGGLAEFEGAIGFNITDSIAARVALMDKSFDGLFTNIVDGKDVGKDDKQGARINLVWDISEETSMQFTLANGEAEGDGLIARSVGNVSTDGATPCPAFVNGGEGAFTSGRNNCWTAITDNMVNGSDYLAAQLAAGNTDVLIANPNPAANATSPWLVNYSSDWGDTYTTPSNFYETEFDGYRIKLVHDFENVQLNWLSAYDETSVLNASATNLTGFASFQEGEFEVWQHELRLSSAGDSAFRWLGGFYYSTQESQEDTWVFRADPAVAGGNGVSPSILIDSEYEAWSVYGQVDYDFTDTWSLTAGLRYTDDKLEGDTQKWVCTPGQHNGPTFTGTETYNREYRLANCRDISGTLVDANPTQELSELGWKLGLNWTPTNTTLIYASVSEGFKGGAYDNRALDNGSSPIGPEFLTAYEIGLKSDWLDNTVQLNASIYLYDWEDLQIFGLDDSGGPAQVNVPETELKGMEVEVKWSPTDALYLQAGIGLSDTEIKDVTGVPVSMGIHVGNSVTNAPEFTGNLLAVYTVVLESSELVFQGSYRYEDEAYFIANAQNTERAVKDSHSWMNARIAFNFGDEMQHSVALWGNNLTEERSCQYTPASLPGGVNWNCQIGDPGERLWGLSLETNF